MAQIFVAFSEKLNFTLSYPQLKATEIAAKNQRWFY
jgi:hypothetical protein